jgi:hypothetical protein
MARMRREIFVFVAGASFVGCGGGAEPADDALPQDVVTTSQDLTIKGDFGNIVVDPQDSDLTIKGDLGNIVDPGILALIFQGDFGDISKPGDETTRRTRLALLKCVRAQVDAGSPLNAIRATCGSPGSATR